MALGKKNNAFLIHAHFSFNGVHHFHSFAHISFTLYVKMIQSDGAETICS